MSQGTLIQLLCNALVLAFFAWVIERGAPQLFG